MIRKIVGSGFFLLVSASRFIMKFRIRIRADQNHGPQRKKKKGKKILLEELFGELKASQRA
jgi:hypothetical protein